MEYEGLYPMKIKLSITSKIAWDLAMNWYFGVFSNETLH